MIKLKGFFVKMTFYITNQGLTEEAHKSKKSQSGAYLSGALQVEKNVRRNAVYSEYFKILGNILKFSLIIILVHNLFWCTMQVVNKFTYIYDSLELKRL